MALRCCGLRTSPREDKVVRIYPVRPLILVSENQCFKWINLSFSVICLMAKILCSDTVCIGLYKMFTRHQSSPADHKTS